VALALAGCLLFDPILSSLLVEEELVQPALQVDLGGAQGAFFGFEPLRVRRAHVARDDLMIVSGNGERRFLPRGF
jgi:hypothetical protein